MFEKFGEFNSAEEINEKARELLKGANTKAVLDLAGENGLDAEDAEDYITGIAKELTTRYAAAIGKLEIEEKDLEIKGILSDWTGYIKEMCLNVDGMAEAVRRKGKKLSECMARLIRYAFENKVQVSDKIVNITKVTHNGSEVAMGKPLYLGIPNRTQTRNIIREYYMN